MTATERHFFRIFDLHASGRASEHLERVTRTKILRVSSTAVTKSQESVRRSWCKLVLQLYAAECKPSDWSTFAVPHDQSHAHASVRTTTSSQLGFICWFLVESGSQAPVASLECYFLSSHTHTRASLSLLLFSDHPLADTTLRATLDETSLELVQSHRNARLVH